MRRYRLHRVDLLHERLHLLLAEPLLLPVCPRDSFGLSDVHHQRGKDDVERIVSSFSSSFRVAGWPLCFGWEFGGREGGKEKGL